MADLEASFRAGHPLTRCGGSAWWPDHSGLLPSKWETQRAMSVTQRDETPSATEPGLRGAHLCLVPRWSLNPPPQVPRDLTSDKSSFTYRINNHPDETRENGL